MNSFFIVGPKRETPTVTQRVEKIREICESTDTSYKTEYPHIVKLCKLCIADICKELTDMINWETSRYKKYTEALEQVRSGTFAFPVKDREELIQDLEVNITDSKFLYNQYHTLYQELLKKKLWTKFCVVCKGV